MSPSPLGRKFQIAVLQDRDGGMRWEGSHRVGRIRGVTKIFYLASDIQQRLHRGNWGVIAAVAGPVQSAKYSLGGWVTLVLSLPLLSRPSSVAVGCPVDWVSGV